LTKVQVGNQMSLTSINHGIKADKRNLKLKISKVSASMFVTKNSAPLHAQQ